MNTMKSSLCFALIFSVVVAINATKSGNFQILNECDQTVTNGVAVCFQYFSPIQFVTDIIAGNKDSLCCTHFKHNACIRGIRDAVKVAKSANLCPNTYSDSIISTLTDSSINNYIINYCKSFNAGKCVMDSVGDVVNTIQGFFVPQQKQQKPVIPQVIDNIFNRKNTDTYNSNVNNDRTSLFNSFREVRNRDTSTENPLINKSIRDLFNGQYIPEASVLKPISDLINGRIQTTSTENPLINKSVKDLFNGQYIPEASVLKPISDLINGKTQTTTTGRPLISLFDGFLNQRNPKNPKQTSYDSEETEDSDTTEESSIFDSLGKLFNNNDKENPSILQNFRDIFNVNESKESDRIVKDITQ